MPIRDIKDHLERFDARYDRMIKIEAISEENKRRANIIRTCAGVFAVLCAAYAVAINL